MELGKYRKKTTTHTKKGRVKVLLLVVKVSRERNRGGKERAEKRKAVGEGLLTTEKGWEISPTRRCVFKSVNN